MEKEFHKRLLKAIVGLGNPGSGHSCNRHNIGFRVVDELSKKLYSSWSKSGDIEHSEARLSLDPYNAEAQSVVLVKPMAYMNNSGRAIPFLLKKGIKSDQILVIHDELEKVFGNVSVKFGGSARGHNGLRSIIGVIGKDFWRLRFGIGRPERKEMVGDYVLSNFSRQEEDELSGLVDGAVEILLD